MNTYTVRMAVLVAAAIMMMGSAFAGQTQAEREWALRQSVNPESTVGLTAPATETGSLPADDAKHAKQLKSKGASEGAAGPEVSTV